jgi:branched-chain amino acid aminotransferase
VREERYSIDQCRADAKSGKLREAFACGTAAVVAPIGRDARPRGRTSRSAMAAPADTEALRTALVDIQRGQIAPIRTAGSNARLILTPFHRGHGQL